MQIDILENAFNLKVKDDYSGVITVISKIDKNSIEEELNKIGVKEEKKILFMALDILISMTKHINRNNTYED